MIVPDRAVFLDRDGTINEELGHLADPDRLRLVSNAGRAIRRLNLAGFRVVVVTNQAGIARGLLTEETLDRIHDALRAALADEGACLDGLYYCPHHPTEGRPPYRTACDCRKPATGMLTTAAADLGLDLARSFFVGDTRSDMDAARASGCRFVLTRTGYGADTEQALADSPVRPDHVAADLLDASTWILGQA
jgi:D-glycero-D-manno-heptose 1,7-bisphosphate phosphatase